ncbi:MAG: exosortase A, partial [Inhella sp.]
LRSDTCAHALLVPPMVLWLVWRKRSALRALVPQASGWGVAWAGGGVLAVAVGDLAQVNALQHFGLVFLLQGAVWAVLGNQVARCLAFPLLFLLFAPPFGEFLLPPMMQATADFTVAALRLTGVPVYREGLQFVIPTGHWSVVEACSGVRYLMASVMVGSLFAYLNFDRWPKRLAFVAFATLMPLVANWVRAYLIVMMGHLSGNELATGADHLIYGWVFFGVVMALMFWAGSRFADPLPAQATASLPEAVVASGSPPRAAWQGALPVGLGLALAAALASRWHHPAPALDWPAALGAPVAGAVSDAAPPAGLGLVPGADAQARWRFAAADGQPQAHLYLAFVAHQRPSARAVASTSVIVAHSDARWQVLGSGKRQVEGVSVDEWRLSARTQGQEGEWRVWRWYWVNGWAGSNPVQAKWQLMWQRAWGQGDAAAMVVLMVPEGEGADRALQSRWAELQAPLNERLSALSRQAAPGHNGGLAR